MKLKLFLLTALSFVGLMLPKSTLAVSTLSVRLGQPKTPTNQSSFKLTFVALDINGGDITVSCYKKSPTDGGYVKFDSDKSLIPGGNTDYCNVDNNILNTSGTYYFKVIANGIESNIATVDYNTTGPSTPGSYSKERINSCDYKIKFKTADDGKTTKVELFRSDSSSMTISSNYRIAIQNIGSNTEGQFINSVPDCSKDYYYAIRDVDNSDNVSGVAGDSFTKVINETVTTTSASTGTVAPSAIAVGSGSQVTEPGASSDNTESTASPANSVPVEVITVTPEVLGATSSRLGNLKWLAIPLVLMAAFFLVKSKKHT